MKKPVKKGVKSRQAEEKSDSSCENALWSDVFNDGDDTAASSDGIMESGVSGAEDFEDQASCFFGILTGFDTFVEMFGEMIADFVVIWNGI